MSAALQPCWQPSRSLASPQRRAFTVQIAVDQECRLVNVCGELDVAARQEFFEACVAGNHGAVIIDMSQLTFLDCSGYGALVAVRLAIQERDGSVTVRSQTGQPAYLLTLLADSDWPTR